MNRIFLVIALMLTAISVQAQWEPDMRLTNDPAKSYTNGISQRNIAASSEFVHVVWYESRDKDWEIYYKRSSDGGVTWGNDTRLTNQLGTSDYPSIAVSGSTVHVAWEDDRDGNFEIYYKRSTDNGVTWGADTRLTNALKESYMPCAAASGSVVSIVWYDSRDGNPEIYCKRSTDAGATWEADTRLTNNTANSFLPSVAVSGSFVHVVWSDYRDTDEELYYKRSTDGGATWGADTRLTNAPGFSDWPCVAASGPLVHIVWWDKRDGEGSVYYKRSVDAGLNWETDLLLPTVPNKSGYASVSSSLSVVHVVWEDKRHGGIEIYHNRSTDGGGSWGAEARLTNNKSSAMPTVSASGSVVHVVWQDIRDGAAGEIYYKRNPTGSSTGIRETFPGAPEGFSLSQNFPNPFTGTTKIEFRMKKSGLVHIAVYDAFGKEMVTLVHEQVKPGIHETVLDAGSLLSGVYYLTMKAGTYIETRKVLVMR